MNAQFSVACMNPRKIDKLESSRRIIVYFLEMIELIDCNSYSSLRVGLTTGILASTTSTTKFAEVSNQNVHKSVTLFSALCFYYISESESGEYNTIFLRVCE